MHAFRVHNCISFGKCVRCKTIPTLRIVKPMPGRKSFDWLVPRMVSQSIYLAWWYIFPFRFLNSLLVFPYFFLAIEFSHILYKLIFQFSQSLYKKCYFFWIWYNNEHGSWPACPRDMRVRTFKDASLGQLTVVDLTEGILNFLYIIHFLL